MSLLGIDAGAAFTGRVLASSGMLLAFEVVIGTVAVVLYDIRLEGWPWLLLIVPCAAAGLGLLGAVAGAVTSSLNASAALVPLLVAPLAVPLLLAATEAMDAIQTDGSILPWVLLMVVVDLVLAIAGVLTARPLPSLRVSPPSRAMASWGLRCSRSRRTRTWRAPAWPGASCNN